MAGLNFVGTITGKKDVVYRSFPVASGVTVTKGDGVYFASGRLTSASVAGQALIGVAEETATGNAGGTVNALVNVDPDSLFVVDNDQDSATFAITDVGKKFDLVGATGAQLVNTNTGSTTTGQLLCIEYNPQISPYESDTSQGLFKIAEHLLYPLGS